LKSGGLKISISQGRPSMKNGETERCDSEGDFPYSQAWVRAGRDDEAASGGGRTRRRRRARLGGEEHIRELLDAGDRERMGHVRATEADL
jgi:hypothetical protein